MKDYGLSSGKPTDKTDVKPVLPATKRFGRKAIEDHPMGFATIASQVCPVCHQENQAADTYCFECGFLLSSQLDNGNSLPRLEEFVRIPHLEDANGRLFPLRPGINTVGREHTDILFPDRSVSRYHSTIVFDEEREIFSVEDSGSTNGSTINDEPLAPFKPRALAPGDKLTFGNIILKFISDERIAVHPESSVDIKEPLATAESTLPNASNLPLDTLSDAAARLVLVRGMGDREILLKQGVTTIGRNHDNTVCLTGDRYVSGHHAKIEVDGDLFLLLDIGSTNGTFLNGLRLTTNTAVAISESDEILIGGNLFKLLNLNTPVDLADENDERTLFGAESFDLISSNSVAPVSQ